MLILGHRGASADAPENTREAFREALAQGADGVELDAMVCASGEVVVCHDPTLERLAGVPAAVARTRWSDLQQLDVGRRLGFGPARIPLLEEVLDLLPAPCMANVELKVEGWGDGGLARKVAELIRRRKLGGRVVVSSFNAPALLRLARAAPELRRGYLVDPERPYWLHAGLIARGVSSFSVHPHESACDAARVAAWHAKGWKVAAWTVDDPRRADQLRRLGVDYCITNRPRALREALAGDGGG